jgi:dynein heavy chain, axonemal
MRRHSLTYLDIYECPAYYYSVRVGTPKFGSYVLTVDLKRGQHTADFWVKRGTALLLNLAD